MLLGFVFEDIPKLMWALISTGSGGYDKLEYRQVLVPMLGTDEVLVSVLAAGINNTEISTRFSWYFSSLIGNTADESSVQQDKAEQKVDAGWNAATPFPIIKGTDRCGRFVGAGDKNGVATIGGPDPKWGERPLKLVVAGNQAELGHVELAVRNTFGTAVAARELSKQAVSHVMRSASEIAKTSVGKIDKKSLWSDLI